MDDDPLGLIDCSAEHNAMAEVLLGAHRVLERFTELAVQPDDTGGSAPGDARVVSICLGICAVRACLARWLHVVEPSQASVAHPRDDELAATIRLMR